jgi:hypothetical protein
VSDVAHLDFVDSIDDADAYEFHTLQVVQCKNTGRLFYGIDSGCSCPTPFEDFTSEADYTPITPESYDAFARDVETWHVGRDAKDKLLSKIQGLLRESAPR